MIDPKQPLVDAFGNDTPDGEERHRAKTMSRKEMAREQKYFWFDGPEVWLVIFAVGIGGGVPFGVWLARSGDTLGDKKMFLIMAVMVAVLVAAFGLGGSMWSWLRKKR